MDRTGTGKDCHAISGFDVASDWCPLCFTDLRMDRTRGPERSHTPFPPVEVADVLILRLAIPRISLVQLLNQRSKVVNDPRDDEHSLVPPLATHS